MNRLMGVRIQQLAYLESVARNRHFQAAADELLVSQSALSQGLARLAASVGFALFEPDGRSRRLTPAGEATLGFARRVLAEANRLDDEMEGRRSGQAGTIRLGLVDAAALYLLRDRLEAFQAEAPGVRLRLTVDTSGRLLDLLDHFELDLAVVIGPAPNESAVELIREPLYVYGPPIDDLTDAHDWVLYPTDSRTRLYIDEALSALGVPVEVTSESNNPSVIAQLVRLGGGWTVLPAGIAETVINPLTRRSEPVVERPLFAVRRSEAPPDPLVDRLVAALGDPTSDPADEADR